MVNELKSVGEGLVVNKRKSIFKISQFYRSLIHRSHFDTSQLDICQFDKKKVTLTEVKLIGQKKSISTF